jgi:hypothetical protein
MARSPHPTNETQNKPIARRWQHFVRIRLRTLLNLRGTAVTDAGLARLKGLARLRWLDLSKTRVTRAGLVHLEGLTDLVNLKLNGNTFMSSGLAQLKSPTNRRGLRLASTKFGDTGLAQRGRKNSPVELPVPYPAGHRRLSRRLPLRPRRCAPVVEGVKQGNPDRDVARHTHSKNHQKQRFTQKRGDQAQGDPEDGATAKPDLGVSVKPRQFDRAGRRASRLARLTWRRRDSREPDNLPTDSPMQRLQTAGLPGRIDDLDIAAREPEQCPATRTRGISNRLGWLDERIRTAHRAVIALAFRSP